MADSKSDEKLSLETANSEPIAEDLSDSDLEDVSGGSTAKNTICGAGC